MHESFEEDLSKCSEDKECKKSWRGLVEDWIVFYGKEVNGGISTENLWPNFALLESIS